MKLSLLSYGKYAITLGYIHGGDGGWYSKEDIFWKKFILKYVSYLKYFRFYFNMLGRREELAC